MYDFHAHSNYSDGQLLGRMVAAADSAGLEGIGVTDHCTVSARDVARAARATYGFNLDLTYERRRRGIERLRAESTVEIYDAVEMDYHPEDEAQIRAFLETAEFDYAIGSVHQVAGQNLQVPARFVGKSAGERGRIVDRYVEALVSLIDSELFDVAAHLDLLERTEPLRGRMTDAHYRQIATAFGDSRTVPEINAGRALSDAEIVHPDRRLFEVLRDHGVRFTLGSDSHTPAEVLARTEFFREFLEDTGIEPIDPPGLTATRQ